MWWFYLFLFILGLQIGSFINASNYRLHVGQSIGRGRSRCPRCQHELNWLDLIPIFGFLLLRGKCRYCHKEIGWHYPLVEFLSGVLLVLIWASVGNVAWAAFYSVVFLIFLAISTYDFKHYLIPDKLLLAGLAVALVFLLFIDTTSGRLFSWSASVLFSGLIAGLVGFFFLGLIHWISRGKAMGFGDVKLIFVIGLITGWPNIVLSLLLSFFIGAIISLGLIGLKFKKLKDRVPFGPFLVLGGLMAVLWGKGIISWYLSLIFL